MWKIVRYQSSPSLLPALPMTPLKAISSQIFAHSTVHVSGTKCVCRASFPKKNSKALFFLQTKQGIMICRAGYSMHTCYCQPACSWPSNAHQAFQNKSTVPSYRHTWLISAPGSWCTPCWCPQAPVSFGLKRIAGPCAAGAQDLSGWSRLSRTFELRRTPGKTQYRQTQ